MECGDVLFIHDQYFLVLEKKQTGEVVRLLMKDLQTGQEKRELFTDAILEQEAIQKVILTYQKSDHVFHYFWNETTNEEQKYRKTFLGTNLDYLLKKRTYCPLVSPIYTNVDWSHIPLGTELELKTDSKKAKIYYTIDGTDPDEHSLLYQKPILINQPLLLKAIAKEPGKKDSFIKKLNCGLDQSPVKIYLSPSKQCYNLGIDGSGYTNEMEEMNLLCDQIEKDLSDYHCLLFRNDKTTYIEDWTLEGREKAIDLHLALHSNASSMSFKKGVEVWVHDEDSDAYGLAHQLYDNLYQIYVDRNNPLTNRGIQFAKGFLAEVNPQYTPCGILIEVAYHNQLDDATWIVTHRREIANQLVQTIVTYYQLRKKEKHETTYHGTFDRT